MVTATQNTRLNRKKCLPPFARSGKSISAFLFGVASLRCAIVLACTLALGSLGVADTTSSITANFNGTAIAGGDTIWFTSVLKPSGLGSNPVTIFVRKAAVTFTANGTNYSVPVPDSNITFSPSATSATISFDSAKNLWQITVPSSGLAGNSLLDGTQFIVPAGGLPGGIQNVKWQASFSTDTSGISMQWQWAAAVYTSFNTNYSGLGVKPVDDNKASQYQNSDHAGTPENYKTHVTGGAAGGGGSNYTGSYSGTASLSVPVVQAPTANPNGPYSSYVSQAISFNGTGSSDPSGYPLNYFWDFGDGTTGTGVTPAHTYSSVGTFTVLLTVDDGRNVTGSTTTSATLTMPPPPTISATLSPAPNASSWNNSNVTVTFTCGDTNVGVKTCPSPVTVTSERANQVVQGTATNNAGVPATTSATVSIDKTPPTITASASPIANSAGWNNTNVTVTFHCSDSLSGVAQCPQPILVSSSGPNQIVSGSATDVAGNTSAPASVTLNIELTQPSIVASGSPLPNAQLWNNTDVTVSFTCTQSSSVITSCTSPQTITTEGATQTVSGTVTDAAGNSNTGKINLNIAKTPPAITAAITPQPNGNLWNNSPVTVSFTCTKTTAPLATCTQSQTVSTEGANQPIPGTVTDVAGNSATATAHVNIATTLPTITTSVAPQPNANHWNNSAVTVTFNCTATTAPIASCPQPQTVSTEGASQLIVGTATDVAGNPATAKVELNVALTPPKIIATVLPVPDASGWNNSSVTVSFVCTNTTAPIATCPPPQTISTEGAGQTVSGTATDIAGNSATASLPLNIGTKPPTIVPSPAPTPNAAGWNNSNVTVSFACAPGTAPVAFCPPAVTLSTEGANQTVSGTASDAAGNPGTTSIPLSIDKTPPTISYTISPAPNSNNINTTTPVTITFTCSDALSGVATCPASISVTAPGMNQVFTGTASDVAGNIATATATVNIQTAPSTAPSIIAVVAPAPNSKGWNKTDVTVSFTCTPGSNPLVSCPSPIAVNTEGANQSFCGKAVDSTGLSTTACASVSLDATSPTITATQSPMASGSGWNNTPVTVTFPCSDSLSGTTCPPPQTVSTDGTHQVISGTAVDVAGNSSTAQVTLNIQQTPPSILQFTAPTQIAPGQSGTAAVTASDNLSGITAVVFQLNGTILATLAAPPYTVTFTAPTTANAGDTLTLTVSVSDAAGNTTRSSARGIQVVLAGVVTGQVLSDATGLPFVGAFVQAIGGIVSDTSDNSGRYSIPSNTSHLFLTISTAPNASASIPATVTVEREVFLQSGVGTVPVDARLTPISAPTSVTPSGGSLTAGAVTIAIAPGAVASATNFHLTLLSQQGLPGLLPLGWSPVVAFDLRADSSTSASFNATMAQFPSSQAMQLVRYDYNTHAWLMVTPNLNAVNGSLTIPIPSVGDFALAVPDAGSSAPSVPSAGQPLAGVAMVTLPTNTAGSGLLNPASVSPTGGTSLASLAIQSPTPLPSGTVIQANISETYTLLSGKQLSDELRTEDILLYQFGAPSGAAVSATFPVTPSQTFQMGQLSSGDVHLDILSGRESVRGQVGGSDALSTQGGGATLTVAAGSLLQDTAIAISSEAVDSFLPTTSTLTVLAEYSIDFSGQVLYSPAQLSVAAGTVQPSDNILLAQMQRRAGVPYLVVVSLAQLNGSNLVTQAVPGLQGIVQGGDYVFYKLTARTGFVSGTVSANSTPIAAVVQTDGLPFVAFSNSAGSFVIPALAGPVNLTASISNTALSGSASVQVIAGQTASANISVIGQVESATVTPANGSVGVPLTAEIDVTAPDAFNDKAITPSNLTLTQAGQGSSSPVAVRFVFSQNNTRLAVFPQSALQPSTTYTFAASGLANVLGGLTSVPTVSFTTRAVTPPNFNTDALVFGMPDQNGNVAISAPANSFPPGTTILIVDQTNGVVLSLTVFNDGSVSGRMPATIDDILAVTITAPDKTTATFTRNQFVAPDGTTAIGAGGGTVVSSDGAELRIPQGALDKGTTFKLETFGPTIFAERPDLPNATFGSGLKITSPQMPVFHKEVKLAFPKPTDAPDGSFYYVYRRLQGPNNTYTFETIDHAFVERSGSQAKVVTAAPFPGLHDSVGAFSFDSLGGFVVQALQTDYEFLMWTFDRVLPGIASQGVVVGKVLRTVQPQLGQTEPTYIPIPDAKVWRSDDNQIHTVARTDVNGQYTLYDPTLGGGSRKITANVAGSNPVSIEVTASEVNAAQPDDQFYGVDPSLYLYYRNVGRTNITFPPLQPPPPPPQINIGVYTLDTNNNRQAISGIVQTGASLTITFASTPGISLVGATINGAAFSSVVPDTPPSNPVQGYTYTRLSDPYPAGTPALYTIVATAINPLNPGTPITVSRSFLVVAAGGGNIYATAGQAPTVINTVPSPNAQSVSVSIFPVITFSEPVTNVSGNVILAGSPSGDSPTLLLIGIRPDGSVANPVQAADAVTSLTIQPLTGLEFGETYTLTLNSAIVNYGKDQNNNAIPKLPLTPSPYTLKFTTFGPQELGSTSSQYEVITRPVVIGQMAYAGEFLGSVISGLGMFDISDPSNPVDKGPGASFIGRAIDIAGLEQSPATGGALVAISAAPAQAITLPGNVWLYSVPSTPKQLQTQPPTRVGGVSVTSSATQGGIPTRLFMKDQFLYTFTFRQGFQVVDLNQVVQEYQSATPVQFGQAMSTEGQGFATDAVVNTIPLPNPSGGTFTMWDLKADDFTTSNSGGAATTQTLLAAAGQLPFVLADPTLSGPQAVLYPPSAADGTFAGNPVQALLMTSADGQTNSLLCYGRAVALGIIAATDSNGNSTNKHIAVVVGSGVVGSMTSCPVLSSSPAPYVSLLAVVDLTGAYAQGTVACDPNATTGSPNCPKAIGFVQLPTGGTDVKLNGSVALVATGTNVLLVNLENPSQPVFAGQITGSFGSWLALTDSGILVGTAPGSANGSLQAAALGAVAMVININPTIAHVDSNKLSQEQTEVEYALANMPQDAKSGQISFFRDGQRVAAVPLVDISNGVHSITIPPSLKYDIPSPQVTLRLVRPNGTQTGPVSIVVHSADAPPQPNVPLSTPTARIDAVTPSTIPAGSPDTQFKITGAGLDQIAEVYALDQNDNWIQLPLSGSSPTQATVLVSSSGLTTPRFVLFSPAPDFQYAQSVLVYSQAVARALVDSNFKVSVVPEDIGGGGTILVSGSSFVPGMRAVLGRGNVAGIVLNTRILDDSNIEADVPFYVPGSDLFVAVLSADGGTLSAPAAVMSSYPYREDDVSQQTSGVGQVGPSTVDLSSVSGNIIWNIPNQRLTLQGPGLVPGLQVNFVTDQGSFPSTTLASQSNSAPLSPGASQVDVLVPDKVSKHPVFTFGVDIFTTGATGQNQIVSVPKPQWVFDVFRVPLGGLGQFTPYFDPFSKKLEVIQPGVWRPSTVVLPVLQKLDNAANFVTWTLLSNIEFSTDVDQMKIARLYQETVPSNKTADLYLRGARIQAQITQLTQIQLSATVSTPNGLLNLQRSFPVQVVKGNIGGASYDDIILNTADRTGIPPQYLKAQGILETHYGDPSNYKNFRYEPITVDFKKITSELSPTTDLNVLYRNDLDVLDYLFAGPLLAPGPVADPPYVVTAVAGNAATLGPQFSLGGPLMAFRGLITGGPRTSASIRNANGTVQPLMLVHTDTWWHKGGLHGTTTAPAPTFYGKAELPNGHGPNGPSSLGPNDFSVDYVNGVITLGRPLNPGDRLTVTYYRVDHNLDTPSGAGGFSPDIALNDRALVKPDFSSYAFNPPETLGGWIETQLSKFPYGNYLTGTLSERSLQFRATCPLTTPDPKFSDNPLHCQPTSVVDARFSGVRAQYVAASSWGPIQVVTTALGDKNFKTPLLNVLAGKPMFNVLSDDQMGFDLGGVFSLVNLQFKVKNNVLYCLPSCRTDQWKSMWNNMFFFYNSGEPKYNGNPNRVIKDGDQYEPK